MQGVFQALSKLLILWAEQRQNEIRRGGYMKKLQLRIFNPHFIAQKTSHAT